MWWVGVALAVPRVLTLDVGGELQAVQVHDDHSSYRFEPFRVELTRSWGPNGLISQGMRRWVAVQRLRERAVRTLGAQDLGAWLTQVRRSLPESSPERRWTAVAASLAGASLDDEPDAEMASQQAARFRQSPEAQPVGLLALEPLRSQAAARTWLASPAPEAQRVLDRLQPGHREALEQMRAEVEALMGRGTAGALLPMGGDDPLLELLRPPATGDSPPHPVEASSAPSIRPQLLAEPCDPCLASLEDHERPSGMPLLLVPSRWTSRNRPVLVGFVGVEVVHTRVHYDAPPRVTDASGKPLSVRAMPLVTRLERPRFVEVETERLVDDAELHRRFEDTLDPTEALSGLLPPDTAWCSCSQAPGWWGVPVTFLLFRVRRPARRRKKWVSITPSVFRTTST